MADRSTAAPRLASGRRFVVVLFLIGLAALALRCTYVVLETQEHDAIQYDSVYYKYSAVALAEGHGFQDPYPTLTGLGKSSGASAEHPPMTTLFLAPVGGIWGTSELAMGLAMATLGAVNVGLIGVLGHRLGGTRVGLIAAAIAAVYPFLWVNDGLIMSETPTVTVVVLCLLATYRLLDRWRMRDAIVLGALCGAAALTRGEFLLLAPLLLAAALLLRTGPPRPRRVGVIAVAALATLLVLMPWVTYNMARFREPVLVSTNLDLALWGTSCDETYYGKTIGLSAFCPNYEVSPGDQSQAHATLRDTAFEYIGDHLDRFPVVVLARAGRTWSVFRPFDMIEYNTFEGRPEWVTATGLAFYYPLLILAIAGAFVARRRISIWPLLVPVVIVTATAFVSLGEPRYRVAAEPVIVVLAAIAIAEFVRRRSERKGASHPELVQAGLTEVAGPSEAADPT